MSPDALPLAPQLSGRAATPMAFIRAIVLAYRRYGMDPAAALALAGIDPASVDDPQARVTAAQLELISGTAMQALDDEALGWFSRRLPWGSYGMLCRASLASPTLGVALKRWCRHHRLLCEDLSLHLEAGRDEARLGITLHRPLEEMQEFCLVTLLRYVLGYACWAIDSRIPLLGSRFPFDAPLHADAYGLMFPGPLDFDADEAGLSFDARYLDLPIRRDEAALRVMLRRALPLTVHQYRRDRLLVQGVRRFFDLAENRRVAADGVAAALHVSVRTLHRQLKEEGSSLQLLKDEARRDHALRLLHQTRQSIKQIAAQVGFGNEKSFSRAFRDWTGLSPQAYREKLGGVIWAPSGGDGPKTEGEG